MLRSTRRTVLYVVLSRESSTPSTLASGRLVSGSSVRNVHIGEWSLRSYVDSARVHNEFRFRYNVVLYPYTAVPVLSLSQRVYLSHYVSYVLDLLRTTY